MYCQQCGSSIPNGAQECEKCGHRVEKAERVVDTSNIGAIKIFLVIGCVINGLLIIPLIWSIPITLSVYRKIDNNEVISSETKVVAFLFVSGIAGLILLLNYTGVNCPKTDYGHYSNIQSSYGGKMYNTQANSGNRTYNTQSRNNNKVFAKYSYTSTVPSHCPKCSNDLRGNESCFICGWKLGDN